jgi:hypothetical protein
VHAGAARDYQVHLFGDGEAIDRTGAGVLGQCLLEPAHPLGMELIEVARGDGEEFHPLEEPVA